jgi:hypothetical protein
VGLEQVNKWHGCAIGLTPSRLVVVARSGRSPPRPRRRADGHLDSGKARGGGGQSAAMEATPGSREEVRMVSRRRELAEARARGGSGNDGQRGSRAGATRTGLL